MKLLILVCGYELSPDNEESIRSLKYLQDLYAVDIATLTTLRPTLNGSYKYTFVHPGKQFAKVSAFFQAHPDLSYDWYLKVRPDVQILEPIFLEAYPEDSINARARVYTGPRCIPYGMSINGPGAWKDFEGARFYDTSEHDVILDDQLFFFHSSVLAKQPFEPGDVEPEDGWENEWFHTRVWASKEIPLNVVGLSLYLTKYKAYSGHTLPNKTMSQYGQDLYIQSQYPEGYKGFFVEIGAHNGIAFSNTKVLEDNGWTGICVEPIPELYASLQRNRTCLTYGVAISSSSGTAKFYRNEGYTEMLSGLLDTFHPAHKVRLDRENREQKSTTKIIDVETKRFSDLFPAGHIDYFSVDVEGAELAVLESIDWDTTTIDWIGVEDNYADPRIDSFLKFRGYSPTVALGCDRMYRKNK